MAESYSIEDLETRMKELDKLQDKIKVLASPGTRHSIAWQELGNLAQQEIQTVGIRVQTIKNNIRTSILSAKQTRTQPIVYGLDQDIAAVKKRYEELSAKYEEKTSAALRDAINSGINYQKARSYYEEGWKHENKGDYDNALEAFEKAGEIDSTSFLALLYKARVLVRRGDRDKANDALKEADLAFKKGLEASGGELIVMAQTHTLLGNKETAIKYLSQAISTGEHWRFLVEGDPTLSELKDCPEFRDLVNIQRR